jgi:hypothetical protein
MEQLGQTKKDGWSERPSRRGAGTGEAKEGGEKNRCQGEHGNSKVAADVARAWQYTDGDLRGSIGARNLKGPGVAE